jgi:aspartyl aminopeptidase
LHCSGNLLPSPKQVKPISKSSSGGCQTINVETYGGGLWYTWFDRDLGLAGRVLVREGAAAAADGGSNDGSNGGSSGGGKLQHRLVKIDKPVLRIPMLAIHLQRNL